MFNFFKKKPKVEPCFEKDEVDIALEKEQERNDHPFVGSGAYINRLPAGTPEKYYSAIQSWKYFVDYYECFEYPKPFPCGITALDVILDIAPKINDKKIIKEVLHDLNYINLGTYDKYQMLEMFSLAEPLEAFRQKWITHSPAKQKELVEILSTYIPQGTPPNFSDGTWYFYVWRQFGIVHIEKKGRYNYVTLPK